MIERRTLTIWETPGHFYILVGVDTDGNCSITSWTDITIAVGPSVSPGCVNYAWFLYTLGLRLAGISSWLGFLTEMYCRVQQLYIRTFIWASSAFPVVSYSVLCILLQGRLGTIPARRRYKLLERLVEHSAGRSRPLGNLPGPGRLRYLQGEMVSMFDNYL